MCAPKWRRKSRIQNIHTGRTFFCVSLTSNEESDASHSADWIQAVDRGGQCRISESTFMVFYEMECTFHRLLNFQTIEKPSMTSDLRKAFHDSIITDENVLFHWAMVNTKKPARILLGKLVELYITISRFLFAQTIVEQYKLSRSQPKIKGT